MAQDNFFKRQFERIFNITPMSESGLKFFRMLSSSVSREAFTQPSDAGRLDESLVSTRDFVTMKDYYATHVFPDPNQPLIWRKGIIVPALIYNATMFLMGPKLYARRREPRAFTALVGLVLLPGVVGIACVPMAISRGNKLAASADDLYTRLEHPEGVMLALDRLRESQAGLQPVRKRDT